jgi:hypothetical protein
MPEKKSIRKPGMTVRLKKAPSTEAGEFVRDEIEAIRKGSHGARSAKQAIAIGLSKARRAGVKLPVPKKGSVPEKTRRQAERESARAKENKKSKPSPKRSRASLNALKREPTRSASKEALSRQAKSASGSRTAAARSASAKKAAHTRAANNVKKRSEALRRK